MQPVITVERDDPEAQKEKHILLAISEDDWEKVKTVDDLVAWLEAHRDNIQIRRGSSFLTYLDFPRERIIITLRYEDGEEILATFDETNVAAVGQTEEEAVDNLKAAIEDEYRHLKKRESVLSERLLAVLQRLERLGIGTEE